MIGDQDLLSLPRWVRRQYDEVRKREVLLAPERVLFPCPTSVHILKHLENNDRQMMFGSLIDRLVEEFDAPRDVIARDVTAMLESLINQRFLDVAPS